ncbi:hypothetical protein HDV02_000016 [Globomyces sp. JEL0801]|nr:hypothetical protein HDV02_000016 [Globomyces sp. JEL0801]
MKPPVNVNFSTPLYLPDLPKSLQIEHYGTLNTIVQNAVFLHDKCIQIHVENCSSISVTQSTTTVFKSFMNPLKVHHVQDHWIQFESVNFPGLFLYQDSITNTVVFKKRLDAVSQIDKNFNWTIVPAVHHNVTNEDNMVSIISNNNSYLTLSSVNASQMRVGSCSNNLDLFTVEVL